MPSPPRAIPPRAIRRAETACRFAKINPLERYAARWVSAFRRSLLCGLSHAAWRQEYSAERRASVEGRSFPVMEQSTRVGNRLLAGLPPADFVLLAPYLRKVSLERDAVLVRSGDPIEQIYFPESGTIAFIMDMP